MGWSYNEAIRLISDYYGADSNIYNQIVSGGASLDTIANALSGIPGMTVDRPRPVQYWDIVIQPHLPRPFRKRKV